ncbi:hypothetical protein BJ508DRAFT_238097 [Ascobolus immersus RN42]|uniref:Rhodopsin domain-containing protein n=1 Tax=Ascobolus immersus RN42 TaxID=1160509 RepID=A0A3N4I8U3_ASCIM|nr:hypothetical protein BJ508DRAFT_238097 [Ascobolus immersus RN42]
MVDNSTSLDAPNSSSGTAPDSAPLLLPADVDRAHGVILIHTILPAIVFFFVVARLYARFFYIRISGWDDAFLVAGWLAAVASDTVICVQTKYGLGRHMMYVNPALYDGFFKLMYCGPLLYVTSHLCIKNSFLLFYLRLASDHKYCRAIYVLLTINTGIFIGCFIPGAFGCKPITFFWNKMQPGKCIELNALYLGNAIMNMLMDVATITLPVFMIWTSTLLSLEKKIKVSSLFLLGAFTVICSIIRIPALNSALLDGDITWDAVDSHKWSNVEIHVATIVACIPAIKGIFTAHRSSRGEAQDSKSSYWRSASGRSGGTLETIGGSGRERGAMKLGGSVEEMELEMGEKRQLGGRI